MFNFKKRAIAFYKLKSIFRNTLTLKANEIFIARASNRLEWKPPNVSDFFN